MGTGRGIPCRKVSVGIHIDGHVIRSPTHRVGLLPVEDVAWLSLTVGDFASSIEYSARTSTNLNAKVLVNVTDHANAVPAGGSNSTFGIGGAVMLEGIGKNLSSCRLLRCDRCWFYRRGRYHSSNHAERILTIPIPIPEQGDIVDAAIVKLNIGIS